MDWFRSFHGAPIDPTWRLIANKAGVRTGDVTLVWWGLMDYASQQKDRGSVRGFDPEVYAAAWDIEEEIISKILKALTEKGKISAERITAWDARNPKREDDSAERVKRFRERCNAVKRIDTQSNPREEESREEKKDTPIAPKGGVVASKYPEDFEAFWTRYPHKVGKDAALRAWQTRRKAGDLPSLDTLTEAIVRYIAAKPTDRAYCNPATWLNQGRWQDALAEPGSPPASASAQARSASEWRAVVDRFRRDEHWPATGYGPQPGYGGCQVPAEILREFGFMRGAA